MHYVEKLPSKSETDASELWNYLECFTNDGYVNNKKGNYKTCISQHAFKDTLHCAHIPFNVVPKGTRPLAQPESLGRGRDSLAKKTQG